MVLCNTWGYIYSVCCDGGGAHPGKGDKWGEGGERSEESQEGKRKRGGHLGEEAGGRGKPESGPAAGAGTWAPLLKETFQTGGGT